MITKEIILKTFDKIIDKCSRFETFDSSIYQFEENGLTGMEFEDTSNVPLEQTQLNYQKELYDNGDYTSDDISIVNGFVMGFYGIVNHYLNGNCNKEDVPLIDVNGEYVNVDTQVDMLHNIIMKSPRLSENTVLWHGGKWVTGLKPGDKGTLDSFTSTSYMKSISQSFTGLNNEGYTVKIYAPSGIKGVCANADYFNPEYHQHEFILDKNQKFVVISQDDTKHEVEILLLKK